MTGDVTEYQPGSEAPYGLCPVNAELQLHL
jgi:hypothetical protein